MLSKRVVVWIKRACTRGLEVRALDRPVQAVPGVVHEGPNRPLLVEHARDGHFALRAVAHVETKRVRSERIETRERLVVARPRVDTPVRVDERLREREADPTRAARDEGDAPPGGSFTLAYQESRASVSNASQPAMKQRPPRGVTGPSQRGPPRASP